MATFMALSSSRTFPRHGSVSSHASIQTTLDRYGHLMPDIHEAEARKLDRLVFGDGVPDHEAPRRDGEESRR
jgi:hypothetical protein